jgi:hypothetical protein
MRPPVDLHSKYSAPLPVLVLCANGGPCHVRPVDQRSSQLPGQRAGYVGAGDLRAVLSQHPLTTLATQEFRQRLRRSVGARLDLFS